MINVIALDANTLSKMQQKPPQIEYKIIYSNLQTVNREKHAFAKVDFSTQRSKGHKDKKRNIFLSLLKKQRAT